ncbi:unnamed protein product, partial [Polarella glacialis]
RRPSSATDRRMELGDLTRAMGDFRRKGRWKEAVSALDDMWLKGLKPDAVAYSAALGACQRSHHWSCAVSLLGAMRHRSVEAD